METLHIARDFVITECVMVPGDVVQCETFTMLYIFMQSHRTDGSYVLQWDFIALTLKEAT
jgi:hypothetical protein